MFIIERLSLDVLSISTNERLFSDGFYVYLLFAGDLTKWCKKIDGWTIPIS